MFIVHFYSLRWCESLKRLAATTQLIMMGNVRAFLIFLLEAQLTDVKAPLKLIRGILFTLKLTVKMCKKDQAIHRQAVGIKKNQVGLPDLFSLSPSGYK